MKRLLILLAVAVVAAAGLGCSSMFNRGAPCGSTYQSSPCSSGSAITTGTDGYLPAPG